MIVHTRAGRVKGCGPAFVCPNIKIRKGTIMEQHNYTREVLIRAADDELTDLRPSGHRFDRCESGEVVEYQIAHYDLELGRLKIGPGPQVAGKMQFIAPTVVLPDGCTDYDATEQLNRSWRFADFLERRILAKAAELTRDKDGKSAARAERAPVIPSWVPKTPEKRKAWRQAYNIMRKMRDEYLNAEAEGHGREPSQDEYRDRLLEDVRLLKDWKKVPGNKTIGRILEAGNKGWLS